MAYRGVVDAPSFWDYLANGIQSGHEAYQQRKELQRQEADKERQRLLEAFKMRVQLAQDGLTDKADNSETAAMSQRLGFGGMQFAPEGTDAQQINDLRRQASQPAQITSAPNATGAGPVWSQLAGAQVQPSGLDQMSDVQRKRIGATTRREEQLQAQQDQDRLRAIEREHINDVMSGVTPLVEGLDPKRYIPLPGTKFALDTQNPSAMQALASAKQQFESVDKPKMKYSSDLARSNALAEIAARGVKEKVEGTDSQGRPVWGAFDPRTGKIEETGFGGKLRLSSGKQVTDKSAEFFANKKNEMGVVLKQLQSDETARPTQAEALLLLKYPNITASTKVAGVRPEAVKYYSALGTLATADIMLTPGSRYTDVLRQNYMRHFLQNEERTGGAIRDAQTAWEAIHGPLDKWNAGPDSTKRVKPGAFSDWR